MNPLLQLFIAIGMASLLRDSGADPNLPGILSVLAAYYALGRGITGALARRVLAAPDGLAADRALRSYRRAQAFHRFLALPGHAWVLTTGGWASMALRVGQVGDLSHLGVALAPWLLFQALAFLATWPAEKHLDGGTTSMRRGLVLKARMLLLVALPFLVLMAGRALLVVLDEYDVPPFRALADVSARYSFLSLGFLLLSLAFVLAVTPVIGMRAIGARPMEEGPLRSRLQKYAARVGLRYRDLYVWPTGGAMLNAAVLGVGARLRCVVFTDALIERLTPDEVEAVFAHEAGHAIHHHIPLFFLFTTGYLMAFLSASALLPAEWLLQLDADPLASVLLSLAGVLVYFGLLFGFVSRRLEQQADVHGLLTTGLPDALEPRDVLRDPSRHPAIEAVRDGTAHPHDHPFLRSLEAIATSMGGVREITGWRHFSIGDRVRFLEAYQRDDAVRTTYRSRLRLLLGLLLGVFLAFTAGAAADLPRQLAGPDPLDAMDRATLALRTGRPADARWWIGAGVRGGEARGRLLGPGSAGLAPDRPALRLTALSFGDAASDDSLRRRPWARIRYAEFQAMALSLAGRGDEALNVALDAVEEAGDVHPLLHAECLLLAADLLDRSGHAEAARAATRRAGERAREAGSGGRLLERSATRRP